MFLLVENFWPFLKLINLNRPNDFTTYQNPLNHPFFVEFSFPKSGFWAQTKCRPGFIALWCQVGGRGFSASLDNFPFHRERGVLLVFCFHFSHACLSSCLTWLLTAWILNIHSLKVSWALTGECKGLFVSRLGELCVIEENTTKRVLLLFIVKYYLFLCMMIWNHLLLN